MAKRFRRKNVLRPRTHNRQRLGRYVAIPGAGEPCSRCGQPTQIREHFAIGARELSRPHYYSRWFYCLNPSCKTTLIMPSQFIVWNKDEELRKLAKAQWLDDQLSTQPGWLG